MWYACTPTIQKRLSASKNFGRDYERATRSYVAARNAGQPLSHSLGLGSVERLVRRLGLDPHPTIFQGDHPQTFGGIRLLRARIYSCQARLVALRSHILDTRSITAYGSVFATRWWWTVLWYIRLTTSRSIDDNFTRLTSSCKHLD